MDCKILNDAKVSKPLAFIFVDFYFSGFENGRVFAASPVVIK